MLTRRQIPNLLTGLRVGAVPLALGIVLLAPQSQLTLLIIFVVASITDFFDGYLARKWKATSALGAMLDPVADKLLVALMLIYIIALTKQPVSMGVIYPMGDLFFPVTAIILREIYISALREFLAAKKVKLLVSRGGKLKTVLQMLGITLVLAARVIAPYDYSMYSHPLRGWSAPLLSAGCVLIWLAALAALASAGQYTRASWKFLLPPQ